MHHIGLYMAKGRGAKVASEVSFVKVWEPMIFNPFLFMEFEPFPYSGTKQQNATGVWSVYMSLF